MAKKITIYSTTYCPHCARAKRLLEEKNIAYEEIDLTDDSQKREELTLKFNWMTVPMIFIGDEFIGGADRLAALNDSGELDQKLQ